MDKKRMSQSGPIRSKPTSHNKSVHQTRLSHASIRPDLSMSKILI